MSVEERLWWDFLERWGDSLAQNNDNHFDWMSCAKELGLSKQQVHEFVDYFLNTDSLIKSKDVEVCMGPSCRANGNEELWQQLIQLNKGRVPEKRINLSAALCFAECDRAPCTKEFGRFQVGKSTKWVERLERL